MSSGNLTYLAHKDIDKERWDHCISKAPNGLIYARSVYLDFMCAGWDAIVAGNYESVMPLPHRKKYGIRYLFIPPFVQQLGFIGHFEKGDYTSALQLVFRRFKYGDLFLNALNSDMASGVEEKTNLVIDLCHDAKSISGRFSNDIRRNLKISRSYGYNIEASIDFNSIVDHYLNNYKKTKAVDTLAFLLFKKLCHELYQLQMAQAYVCKDENGNIDAAAILFIDEKRVYLILNSISEKGRMQSANHALIAALLEIFAEKALLFDFEGSDIAGIQYFFLGFGAQVEKYFFYHFNNLPFPLNIIKP